MGIISQASMQFRSRLVRGSFSRNVLIMFAGTALGQFGSVLLAPLLTRIYTPEQFGILGVFTAVLSILSVLAAMRYEIALPLAKNNEESANLLVVCLLILTVTTIIAGLIIALISINTESLSLLGIIAPYRWLLPVGFFCIGAYHIMIYYATHQGNFNVISRTKVYQGIIGPTSQIGFGLLAFGGWGLLTGFILGQSTGIWLLFRKLVLATHCLKSVSIGGIRAMLVRYQRFPLISSWSALIESAGNSSYFLPVVIPFMYSPAIAGFVLLTDRVIARPLYMISTSVLQVYVGSASKLLNSDPAAMRRRFLQVAGAQLIMVSLWLIPVNLIAPYVFSLVFGHAWDEAVPYLHILSIVYLPQIVMHGLAHTLRILERQGLSAIWETGRLLAAISVFAYGYYNNLTALETLFIYSIVEAFAQIVLFLLMYKSIQSIQKINE